MPTNAVIYARISRDDGSALGVTRQVDDCTALIASKGWTLIDTYVDNDVSATRSRTRPAYAQLLAAIASGQIGALVVWDIDRLTRRPAELEHIIDLADKHKLKLANVGGEVDLATPQGRLTARIKGNVARHEAEQMGVRIRRAQLEKANKGLPHGSIPFGWDRVLEAGQPSRNVINQVQAAVVQEAARRLIGAESLAAIAKDFNARSLPTPRGALWQAPTLRQLLLRPANAGLRQHQGQVVGQAAWDPILSRDVWDRVVAILGDPARRKQKSAAVKHLLSGIARCGLCESPMSVNHGARQASAYTCRGCTRVRRHQGRVDAEVVGQVLGRLADPALRKELLSADTSLSAELREEVHAIEARLDIAADSFADGDINAEQLKRITARLTPALDSARNRLNGILLAPDLQGITGAVDQWEKLPVTRKRAVIKALTVSITINPVARTGRNSWAELAIVWR